MRIWSRNFLSIKDITVRSQLSLVKYGPILIQDRKLSINSANWWAIWQKVPSEGAAVMWCAEKGRERQDKSVLIYYINTGLVTNNTHKHHYYPAQCKTLMLSQAGQVSMINSGGKQTNKTNIGGWRGWNIWVVRPETGQTNKYIASYPARHTISVLIILSNNIIILMLSWLKYYCN